MKTVNTTRQLLLEQGMQIAAEKGLRGIVVREVVARSGVNLGSFVYHFSTRERFLEELVELWYAPMYERLKVAAEDTVCRSALERLQATLCQAVDVAGNNASFIGNLLADAVAGERTAQQFLLKIPGRHPKLLLELIARAQREGSVVAEPPLHLLTFIMAAVGFPLLAGGDGLQLGGWLPESAAEFKCLLSDTAGARRRLSWAIKGICIRGDVV